MALYTSYYTTPLSGSICIYNNNKKDKKTNKNVILIMSTMFILFNVFLFNAIEKRQMLFDTHI